VIIKKMTGMSKKILTVIICLVLAQIPLFAQDSFKPGSEPTGFKGVQWGTPQSSFSGLRFTNNAGATLSKGHPDAPPYPKSPADSPEKCYVKDNEPLEFEGVSVNEINYTFYNDKFSGVFIVGQGRQKFDQLKAVFFAKYGEAKQESSTGIPVGGYTWQGNKTIVRLMLTFTDDFIVGLASVEAETESLNEHRQKALSNQ
jgi:hypothetical protein